MSLAGGSLRALNNPKFGDLVREQFGMSASGREHRRYMLYGDRDEITSRLPWAGLALSASSLSNVYSGRLEKCILEGERVSSKKAAPALEGK